MAKFGCSLISLGLLFLVAGCTQEKADLPEGALYHFVSKDNRAVTITLYEDELELTGMGFTGEDQTIALGEIQRVRKIGTRVWIYVKGGGETQFDLLGLMGVSDAGKFADDLRRLVDEAQKDEGATVKEEPLPDIEPEE